MDDSFAFRTTMPLRRRIDPTLVKAAIFGTLVVLSIILFAAWVVASERASFTQTDPRVAPSEVTITGIDGAAAASSMDSEAETAAGIALASAQAVFTEHGSFLRAGPAQLSRLRPGYTFVDGPSTMARVVSVASTADTWAAAVQDPGGTCYRIRVTRAGDLSRSIGPKCSGEAALNPRFLGRRARAPDSTASQHGSTLRLLARPHGPRQPGRGKRRPP